MALTVGEYLKSKYGCKVYRIALDGGFTCPNRDGKISTGGCIFCSAGGSGDFAESRELSISEQIEKGKERVAGKIKDGKYIAYFQAFTNTYAPVSKLRSLFTEAINHPDIVGLSIATRPDCLPEDVLDLLDELNRIKPVWVELGLQTIHERTAEYIRRGYPLAVYDRAVSELKKRNISFITHVILGLPGERCEDMEETVRYVCGLSGAEKRADYKEQRSDDKAITADPNGIKLQLLHVLKGTDLAKDYEAGKFTVLSEDEYIAILERLLKIIPDSVIIHRLTGDGPKKDLIAPIWSADKKHVLNRINRILAR
ncbi:MAG: TIGR01212 family radical SAM protein [Lachnospiraceae bacterium]|nr:TIGR01212 family radical SAM protein [Lachnospiraceae bacterium]MBR6303216.1 TIGR01212 family radical SAM protein [Lachnospiraceae bacterium]